MEQFEVVFLDDDEVTVLDRQNVNKGESVTYKGTKTEKEEEDRRYVLVGWVGQEKMESVEENLSLIAKYEPIKLEDKSNEENGAQDKEELESSDEGLAYYEATLESAKSTTLSSTIESGTRLTEQQLALLQDTRTPQEIVAEVKEKGSVTIGESKNTEMNIDDDYEK